MKVFILVIIISLFIACSQKKEPAANPDMTGMKMDSAENDDQHSDEVKLNAQQIKLGNIQVDTIKDSRLEDKIVLTATLTTDQRKTVSINSRVMGRIEVLYFKNPGDYVNKGARLYDLYSEDLNNAKQEFLQAMEQKSTLNNPAIDFNSLIGGAKNKLLLWGMNEAQIDELVKTGKAAPRTTFYSNASGYITQFGVKEGDYIMEGGTVLQLADLSTIWAEAQVYASQLSQIDKEGSITVKIPSVHGMEIQGKIEFVNPELNPGTRINLIRVSIPNPGNIRPGMSAYVFIKNRQQNMLSLPINAVIRDGKSAIVWIQTGPGTFKNEMVSVGMENGDRIEIKSGLKPGDLVVISGAYLLSSEYKFRKGSNPMGGMKM